MDKHRRGAIVSSALAQRRAGKNDRIKVGEKRTKKMIQKLKRSLLLQQPTFRQYGSLPRGHDVRQNSIGLRCPMFTARFTLFCAVARDAPWD